MQPEAIELKQVSTNNLKGIDVSFPLGRLITVTGVSGSGKSSLVFDTLYAESYRRYIESLSSYAKQFMQSIPRPPVGDIQNLPPAVAVRQSRSRATSRSTVGTMTEILDLVRVMFCHLATIVCPGCDAPVTKNTPDSVTKSIRMNYLGKKIFILCRLSQLEALAPQELIAMLSAQGFSRMLLESKTIKISDCPLADLHRGAIIIDRLTVDEDQATRLAQSLSLAFKLGKGRCQVMEEGSQPEMFSDKLECVKHNILFREPCPAMLSFNHPLGACPHCQGFGSVHAVAWNKVFPDLDSSLALQGVAVWNFGSHNRWYGKAERSALKLGIEFGKPFRLYTESEWNWLKNGKGGFSGVEGYFEYLDSKKYRQHYRIHAARFKFFKICAECNGNRLAPHGDHYKLQGNTIVEASRLTVSQFSSWVNQIKTQQKVGESEDSAGLAELFRELDSRLQYLLKVGLSYLQIDRLSRTLSGGELQRISMARCLGSALTDSLFCLDEPTSGLHARDTENLLEVLTALRNMGNTIVVVEHDQRIIDGSDRLIQIGPGAGHLGGNVVSNGEVPTQLLTSSEEPIRSALPDSFIVVEGACTHNLKNVSAQFPSPGFTVVCGVSGSGKTSLVQHTLFPLVAGILGKDSGLASDVKGVLKKNDSLSKIKGSLLVSQASLSRSSRSNVATYLGVMDEIRRQLAAQPLSKELKLNPGAFSFNIPGGRCEVCRGLGTVTEDLSFLGDVDVICPSCLGKRFNDEVLSVRFMGRNINELLLLTVTQAREIFFDHSKVTGSLDVLIGLGLGYLTLGQHTSSFSGGEAQRLKMSELLSVRSQPHLLVFDEPSSGLGIREVNLLILQMKNLARHGHAVVVVEHHLSFVRSADWVIEVGPESAEGGGEVLYQGQPKGLSGVARSRTAPYL